jgi:hypothetical protein
MIAVGCAQLSLFGGFSLLSSTEKHIDGFSLEQKRLSRVLSGKETMEVERAFAEIKRRCRRLMLRWEQKAFIRSGFVTLGVIYTSLKNLVG